MAVLVERQTIPGGDAGTAATVKRMAAFIREGSWQPVVRQQAVKIVAGVNGRDGLAQAEAIRAWLVEHFHFVRDPTNTELLHTPVHLLTTRDRNGTIYADCDDAAILGGALGQAVGLQARLVVAAFLAPNQPFRHVWSELAAPVGPDRNTWVELDVTRQTQQIPMDKISRLWIVPVTASTATPTLVVGVLIACTVLWALISSKHSRKRPAQDSRLPKPRS